MYNSFIGFIGLHFGNNIVARMRNVWDKGLHDIRRNKVKCLKYIKFICKLVQNNELLYLAQTNTKPQTNSKS